MLLQASQVDSIVWAGIHELTRPGALISATRILLTTPRSRKSIVQMWINWKSPGPTIQATSALMNSIRSVIAEFMYVIAQHTDIVALDATTGKRIWIHHSNSMGQRFEVHRGINYWQSKDGSDKRLLIPFDNHTSKRSMPPMGN